MDKEKVVQIYDGKGKGLRFVDEQGTSHSYDLLTSVRTIYLNAHSLSVSEGFGRRWSSEESTKQPATRRFVRGYASLCDESISVIGDPSNKATRVALSIRVRTAEEHAWAVQQSQQRKDGENEVPPDFDAHLGFTNAERELGTNDEWWLELHVAEKALDSLADAILNNHARSLHIGVGLSNVYTDAGPGELDFGEPINLFLRPSVSEGNVRRPVVAYGQLERWSLRFAGTAELSDPFEPELTPTSDEKLAAEPDGPSDTEKALSALERLTAIVGELRSTVIRATWILAAILIISAFMR